MQTIQTFAEFQQSFGREPVETEITPKIGQPFKVHLKPMSSRDRDRFEFSLANVDGKKRDTDNFRARLVALCVCESTGELWFKTPEDALRFGDENAGIIEAMFKACQKLNGMESTEELGKDSSETESSDFE